MISFWQLSGLTVGCCCREALEASFAPSSFSPVEGHPAWYAADCRDSEDWIHVFSSDELKELETAIHTAESSGKDTKVLSPLKLLSGLPSTSASFASYTPLTALA